ncbi:MAG: hypothetical protein IJA85_10375 [Clostridia bacterium]|nr:hypothetical protein [Clostridia bacterium]
MKKCISCLLLCSLILSTLTACGQSADTDVTDETTAAPITEAVETADPTKDEYGRDIVKSSIPDDTDFGGAELTILLRDRLDGIEYEYEFIAEAENGDLINDAIFKRNRETEEDLGITFEHISGFGNPGEYQNVLNKSIRARDGAYDIAAYYAYFGSAWAINGFFYNLLDLDYLDFEKPWWNRSFVDEMTISDTLYAAVGDVSLTSINRVYAMFFNKVLAAEYCPDVNFYDLVREGKWTIDTFAELNKGLYNDINGNSERDDDDFYGWATSASAIPVDGLQVALGLNITESDSDGMPTFVYGNERSATAYEKIYDLYFHNPGVQGNPYGGEYVELCSRKMMNGSTLFLVQIFKETDLLRDMEDDYGVLPIFMLDESQNGYYTTSHDAFSLISIVSTCEAPEIAAAALEKLSETSYKYVTPTYFEVALKTKYARGDEDSEMYDIIIEGRTYNFGMVMSSSCGNIAQLWRTMLDGQQNNFVSSVERQTKSITKQIEKLVEKFEKLAAEA